MHTNWELSNTGYWSSMFLDEGCQCSSTAQGQIKISDFLCWEGNLGQMAGGVRIAVIPAVLKARWPRRIWEKANFWTSKNWCDCWFSFISLIQICSSCVSSCYLQPVAWLTKKKKEEKQTLRRRGTDPNPQHIKWPCNTTLQMGSPWACRWLNSIYNSIQRPTMLQWLIACAISVQTHHPE